ncbi:antibiotic biosynthesis monooxygenase [Roseomonas sp. CECT 9278]|uniref:antibiotic biosynthesis monooxygenase family protein n=1 Tax=Roseomonas sp. CECT 9278 TaxID=2845823 RepID=UPI001E59C32D|nr:antibiotic biosynthesis monooxygenase [Roseomonas sp. CECT 9278]CAH0299347.1 Heme oxygenase (staphylobilin-producing) [Roseomonas sp. CECT 9278]
MFVASNRFRVIPSEAERFEQTWLTRETRLHEVDGFVAFHLLKGPQAEDHVLYASTTFWASKEAFEAWTRSDQFRRAHANAGAVGPSAPRPTMAGPSQFEAFEVLQTIAGKPRVAA